MLYARVHAGEKLDDNIASLGRLLKALFDGVLGSPDKCPLSVRQLFSKMRERVADKFSDDEDVPYIAVCGFLFLRFFAPAVLSPTLFGMRFARVHTWYTHGRSSSRAALRNDRPDAAVSRRLTLMSKCLQALGNLAAELGSAKEQFMAPVHGLIRAAVPQLRKFIDDLTNVPAVAETFIKSRRGSVQALVDVETVDELKAISLDFKRTVFKVCGRVLAHCDAFSCTRAGRNTAPLVHWACDEAGRMARTSCAASRGRF
jgi:hypothetical protein